MYRESQSLVGRWLLQTGDIPVGYQEAHLEDEVGEFRHEFDNGRDPERLREELADVAIAVLGLAVQYEVDLQAEIERKMGLVEEKYDPRLLQFYMERGMNRGEAMATCKRGWERRRLAERFMDESG